MLENRRAAVESLENRPDFSVSKPEPSAELFATLNEPPDRVTPPLKVLVPPRVSVEVPPFTKAPEPLSTPLKTVAAVPLIVSVLPLRFTAPAPARLPISSEEARFRVATDPSVRLDAFAKALPPASVSVPWLTVVAPAKVLLPLRVSSAAPSFTSGAVPLRLPLTSTALLTLSTELAAIEPAPAKLSEPLLIKSPRVTVPASTKPLAIARAVAESLETRPPCNAKVPVPKAVFAPT